MSEDIKNNENEEVKIMTFLDEEGNKVQFEAVARIFLKEKEYLLLAWDKKKYVSLANNNPIKFLLKTHGEFFKEKEQCLIALQDDLKDIISNEAFKKHMKDSIDFRVESYYKNRFFNRKK